MSDQALPTNPMAFTLDQFNVLRNNFTSHYFLRDCNPNFGGQEIQVSWNSFSLAVHNFISANQIPPHAVAIRFVLCYDPKNNVLYLRMQILAMSPVQGDPSICNLIDSPSAWYELSNGSIIPTDNTDLFDAEYLKYFYYCNAEKCDPSTVQNLAEDKDAVLYARTVVMPWLVELSQLYIENGLPTNATLCIDAGSFLNTQEKIQYQHGLVAYLRKNDGTPMLDNTQYILPFQNKAADCGTLCPPTCNVYIFPTSVGCE